MKKVITAMAAILTATVLCAQTAQESTTAEKFESNGKTLLYRQYVTPGATGKIPLVLFLHGAGERGDNNVSQLVHGVQPIIDYSRAKKMPLAVIAPQCPNGKQWVDTPWGNFAHRPPQCSEQMGLVIGMLKDRIKALNVDTSRVYVTGLSMGGYGTWDILMRCPELFAAGIPICGGGDTTRAWIIRDIPIWAFHGDVDGAVPVYNSRSMVSALWACNGKIRYREYPGYNHNVWTVTYEDEKVLDWFFSQHK